MKTMDRCERMRKAARPSISRQTSDDMESIMEEEEDEHEELIKRTRESGRSCNAIVEVQELRYSQLSCKETFQCGRSVSQLVQDLLDRKVSLFAPFLRLTVFETTDEETNDPILRCIDNQRLFALKEYAKKSGKDRLMVNVNLFSQNTLTQVQRFIQNSYDTDGRDVCGYEDGSEKAAPAVRGVDGFHRKLQANGRVEAAAEKELIEMSPA
eukprot:symbB.v1.2.029210.t1/scaffold3171.1/size96351/10